MSEKKELLYVFDAYCGWCYGFDELFAPMLARLPELPLRILSGGLFTGRRAQPIKSYGYFREANVRINRVYGVTFGEAYNRLLESSDEVLDSTYPALAFSYFRQVLPMSKWGEAILGMQRAFYQDGLVLGKAENYRALAEPLGLAADALVEALSQRFTEPELAQAEFAEVRDIGVETFPTFVGLRDDGVVNLISGARTPDDLIAHVEAFLKD